MTRKDLHLRFLGILMMLIGNKSNTPREGAEKCIEATDEYAEDVSVEFLEWCNKHYVKRKMTRDGTMAWASDSFSPMYSAKDVYRQFLKDTKK